MSHQCWSGQRNSTLRKKGLFAVWESIGLLLGAISFKSIQNRNRWGPERQAQHLSALRNFKPKSYDMYLHRIKQGGFTCQNPKSSPTELKLAMTNFKQSPLFDSQRVMTRQSGR